MGGSGQCIVARRMMNDAAMMLATQTALAETGIRVLDIEFVKNNEASASGSAKLIEACIRSAARAIERAHERNW
jgi:hypothetical protein